ncbi:MAG: gephyrin-like molybdotransferase Glp [Pseudomonadota bacterium]
MTILQLTEKTGCGCDHQDIIDGLLSIDAALARLEAATLPIEGVEELDLIAAQGRILASPVVAQWPVPRFDNSAMDGYAIDIRSLKGSGPWTLRVNGRIAAGGSADVQTLHPGATQIFTWAPLPVGVNAVLPQESVQRDGDTIILRRKPERGAHIRVAGEDMAAGATILPKKMRLGPCEIAAAAAAGASTVRVRRRLSVAILATGDEVHASEDTLSNTKIADVNSPMLATMFGADVELVEIAYCADELTALTRKLRELEKAADLIITTGGISVGATDHVKSAMAALGGLTIFSGVAMKPGKPVTFGRLGHALWLGLPGNPVSAFTAWKLFGNPLVDFLCNARPPANPYRHVTSAKSIRHKPGRCEVRLARIFGCDGTGREIVDIPESTRSAQVSDMINADGFIFIPADADRLTPGDLIKFLPFHRK